MAHFKEKRKDTVSIKSIRPLLIIIVVVLLALVALPLYKHLANRKSFASESTTFPIEPESANLARNVTIGNDPAASNGQFIQFNNSTPTFQPTAPYYATFYYPWYKSPSVDGAWSDWQDNGHTPPANWFSNYLPDYNPAAFDPSTELYSSNDDHVLYWQLQKFMEAKQEVGISSWWGQGHKTDTSFNHIITDVMNRQDNPYPHFRWTNYYEKEGDNGSGQPNDPSVAEIVSDLNYIYSHYASQPAYFRINDRPVIFVYSDANDCSTTNPCDSTNTNSMVYRWNAAKQQAQGNFYVVLKVFSGYATAPFQPDNWHQYAPAGRSGIHGTHAAFVSPGFWKSGDAVRLPRDLSAFQSAVSGMVAANTTFKIVETWNEWGEGSSVEPGDQVIQTTGGTAILDPNGAPFKNQYIDVLNQSLPPLE